MIDELEESDESDEEDDLFDSVCAICDNGGDILWYVFFSILVSFLLESTRIHSLLLLGINSFRIIHLQSKDEKSTLNVLSLVVLAYFELGFLESLICILWSLSLQRKYLGLVVL